MLDDLKKKLAKGGKLYPLAEAVDTFVLSPSEVTRTAPHVRDALDLKRVMFTVVVALIPCFYMAMWNTGYQANMALEALGRAEMEGWRGWLMNLLGAGFNSHSWISNVVLGATFLIPIYIACNIAGGVVEVVFSVIRGHEINEGFLVTGSLIPLIMPPHIPLWQVMIGTAFGVTFGKELFGGTGKNIFNPALIARAFLFFAYPAQISGDSVWVAVDGFSGATPLALAAEGGAHAVAAKFTWWGCFIGAIPGSMGETSTLACLLGAAVLVISGIGSWRIMTAVLAGSMGLATLLMAVSSTTNPMFTVGPIWHLVMGGLAFGLVYMATDPVSAAMTRKGQWIYGVIIGAMVILIRSVNPAFPEGVMLAILFGNAVAPVIDRYVLQQNIKRRLARCG